MKKVAEFTVTARKSEDIDQLTDDLNILKIWKMEIYPYVT